MLSRWSDTMGLYTVSLGVVTAGFLPLLQRIELFVFGGGGMEMSGCILGCSGEEGWADTDTKQGFGGVI